MCWLCLVVVFLVRGARLLWLAMQFFHWLCLVVELLFRSTRLCWPVLGNPQDEDAVFWLLEVKRSPRAYQNALQRCEKLQECCMLLREVGLQEDKGPRWFVEASNFFAAQTFLSEHGVVLSDALLRLQDVWHIVVDQHHHKHVMIALASIPAKENVKVRRRSAFRIRPMMHIL